MQKKRNKSYMFDMQVILGERTLALNGWIRAKISDNCWLGGPDFFCQMRMLDCTKITSSRPSQ